MSEKHPYDVEVLEIFKDPKNRLGSRLIQSQKAKAVASATPERKLAASLS